MGLLLLFAWLLPIAVIGAFLLLLVQIRNRLDRIHAELVALRDGTTRTGGR